MNKEWIVLSYEWTQAINEVVKDINNNRDYLDILGLYETCWLIYKFDDTDKTLYGYPNYE